MKRLSEPTRERIFNVIAWCSVPVIIAVGLFSLGWAIIDYFVKGLKS